jgi:NAD(P)-dependent dehydrogenase (short-subunit alcohol dehydrogenase family)
MLRAQADGLRTGWTRLPGHLTGIPHFVNQPAQQLEVPGVQSDMSPVPDCGEESYVGSGKLTGKVAVITGADSGIGRAVAIAYAREGADVLISYLSEDSDAREVAGYVEKAGRRAVLVRGDLADADHCREIVATAIDQFGGIDVLVSNAAFQMNHTSLEEISLKEWDRTFDTNIRAMFVLCKEALPHMKSGASIIGSSSVNSDMPSPELAPYAATKAAIANFCASLAQLLGERGIRVNSVAPGPVWTPLIPATMPEEKVKNFGSNTPLGRAGQPVELAPVHVLLASDEASYISGARVAVTGGRPIL